MSNSIRSYYKRGLIRLGMECGGTLVTLLVKMTLTYCLGILFTCSSTYNRITYSSNRIKATVELIIKY